MQTLMDDLLLATIRYAVHYCLYLGSWKTVHSAQNSSTCLWVATAMLLTNSFIYPPVSNTDVCGRSLATSGPAGSTLPGSTLPACISLLARAVS